MDVSVREIAQECAAVASVTRCSEVYEMFACDEDLMTLVVVEGRRPVGLVNRNEFLIRLAQLYGRALYDRKPVAQLMDPSPLIVDVETALADLNRSILVDKPSALLKGFIVTENENYVGIGNAHTVLQMNVDVLAARNESLESAKKALIDSSFAKSRFLANMSHELRTPLNAIIGFAEIMLAEKLGRLGNPQYRDFAQHIRESGEHLLQLINSVLDYTRIESGRYAPRVEDVDVGELVEVCVNMMKVRAEEAGVTLAATVGEGLGSFCVDGLKLRQTVINLLSNSIKFTQAGGRVEIVARRTGDGSLGIDVTDTGIGMSEADLVKALEPFSQVENDLNRRYDGSGLGLPLARKIVEAQDGHFSIDSEVGVGTSIRLVLPGRQEATAELRCA